SSLRRWCARGSLAVSSRRGERTRPMTHALLPHHKLHAFGVAMKLLDAVREARIRNSNLRDQAMRAAKSAALNAAEGAGRVTRADARGDRAQPRWRISEGGLG